MSSTPGTLFPPFCIQHQRKAASFPTFIPSKTSSTPGLSSMIPFFFDEPASKAFRKYEMADDMSGNCPPLDLATTHFRKRVLSTEADENISGRRSALSSPSRTLRKSLTCLGRQSNRHFHHSKARRAFPGYD